MSKEGSIFQRVEKKYQMDQRQYEAFLKAAENRIHMDEFGLHTINNIYFDTEKYDLIRTSIEKPKYKEKFRVRGYGEITENSRVFLEIKKKYKGIVYKRRVAIAYREAKAFWEGRAPLSNDDQISREITYFFDFYKPIPKLFLAYDRKAYVGNEDNELRITIDQNIRSRSSNLNLCAGSQGRLLENQGYLMEIKVPLSYPVWLAELLSELEIYPVSFSKYGTIYKNAVNDGMVQENQQVTQDMSAIYQALDLEGEGEACLQVY